MYRTRIAIAAAAVVAALLLSVAGVASAQGDGDDATEPTATSAIPTTAPDPGPSEELQSWADSFPEDLHLYNGCFIDDAFGSPGTTLESWSEGFGGSWGLVSAYGAPPALAEEWLRWVDEGSAWAQSSIAEAENGGGGLTDWSALSEAQTVFFTGMNDLGISMEDLTRFYEFPQDCGDFLAGLWFPPAAPVPSQPDFTG